MNEKEMESGTALEKKGYKKLTSQQLESVIEMHNTTLLKIVAETYPPVVIANALNGSSMENLAFFFKSVPSDFSAEVFSYLEQDTQEQVVSAFNSEQIKKIIDELSMDDLVDFVEELPTNLITKVINSASALDKAKVKANLNFKEDSAGSLMTTEYMSAKCTCTVKDTKESIRKIGKEKETIWDIFVLSETRVLLGIVTLDRLLESDDDVILTDIMIRDFASINFDTDQELVLQAFRKYDVSVLPVTNSARRLLGIITFDDVIDVALEENDEDTKLTSAVLPSDKPYLKSSVLHLVKNYVVWLIILLVLNTFTSMAMSYLSALGPLLIVPILSVFLPTIMGTNGNASDQTATVVIRELALKNISTKNYKKALFKEFRASLITALILSLFSFIWILVELYSGLVTLSERDMAIVNECYSSINAFNLSVSALISLTFFFTTILAKFLGLSLPLLALKCHLDPAVMSQPLISTLLDILSIVVYYLLSMCIFHQFI